MKPPGGASIFGLLSSDEELEWISLSWKLIEWKIEYYMPEKVHSSRKQQYPDELYDIAEQRYLTLCRKLNKMNTLVHKAYPGFEDISLENAMMEIDISRPSVELALSKLCRRKK